jgi:hypothetical protein
MPGTSGGVRGNLNFDVGGEELWRQVGRLAGTVGEMGMKLHLQQAEIQYQDSLLKAENEITSLSDRLRQNQDEDTYDAELNKSVQTINKFRPKNPLAAREYDAWVRRQTPEWKQDVKKAKEIRLNNKWVAMRDTLAEQAIDTGGLTKLQVHLASGIALGRTNVAAAGAFLRKTENAAEYNMGLNWALTNPEGLLDAIEVEDGKTQIKGLSTLKSGQVVALRSNAEGTINFRKRQEIAASSAIYNDVLGHAAKGTLPQEMKELLKNTQGITEVERTRLMETYLSAYKTWQGTGSNPWTTTHNYGALMEMQLKISQGEPVTEMDIWRRMLTKDGPAYSLNDARNLINQLPDKKNPALNTPFAREWADVIDVMFTPEGQESIPPENIDEWWKTQLGVQEIIKAHYPDITKTTKEIESYLNPEKEKKAKTLLSRIVGMHPAALTLRLHSARLGFLAGRKISESIFPKEQETPAGLPQPTTKAEYDAIPKGARYIHPDYGEVLKR